MRTWSRRAVLLGGLGSLLAACSMDQAGMTPYTVAVRGDGNQVTLHAVAGRGFVAQVTSDRGIGDATVAWWGQTSAHQLGFELHLRGLEHFSLLWADQEVSVGVNAADQSVFESHKARGGTESALTPESPFWMEVTSPPSNDTGYFVAAPAAFGAAWPGVWAIEWVDFYR